MSSSNRRVSVSDLEAIVLRINRMTNSPETSYVREKDGRLKANIGNFHLSGAYGGWSLQRTHNLSGGVYDVLQCGHVSKPELQRLLFAFIKGMEYANAES
jgi:hypothetical protein